MTSSLQQMRREAGYRSARDFAVEINIPPSTYSRYERHPESIPTYSAMPIADKLGCSVDKVLGRKTPGLDAANETAERILALPNMERGMLLDYLNYLENRAQPAQ